MKILIESQYLPPVAMFSAIKNASELQIDLDSYYVKGTYRNRCHICVANGEQRLSVPLVKGKHQKTLLKNVKISYDEDWRKDHWQSIVSAYGRSAFFDFYRDSFQKIFFTDFQYLIERNQALLSYLFDEMGFDIKISQTTDYIVQTDEGVVDLRNKIHPKVTKNQFDFMPKAYEQVFANKLPFLPNLSIIDLLFTQGPLAKDYL